MIDEKRAENLSALLDDALGYTETRKLWKQLESDTELQKQWDRYNRISQMLSQKSGILPDGEFRNRISAAIAAEPTVLAPGAVRNRLKEKVISTALAASLAVTAVIVGKSMLNPAGLDGRLLVAEVRHEPVPSAASIAEVDPDFQNYLVLHNETAYLAGAQGLIPYARVVSAQPTR